MADKTNKPVTYDVDGFDVVTAALRELLNSYPGLASGEDIAFASLGEQSGFAMFPTTGAVIEQERRFITGDTEQMCLYPFTLVRRAYGLSENAKSNVKEYLDSIGRWLEKQTVTISGKSERLSSYPALTGSRRFTAIARQTPAYLESVEESGSENWVIAITARYINEIYTE